ncbi:FadR/GntR family transcriptional regulator [Neomoorella humiferrea]|uniref:FadR/GntR family transcriptional regulator n=1 Tax=Neomoorella humiferrea TaxID=676965 RepID=UPI003D94BFEE
MENGRMENGRKLVEHNRLYEQVADKLQEMILQSEMRPGERVPPEAELTKLFNVSRTTIREAIKLLKERGLVEISHGKGVFVAEPQESNITALLTLYLRLNDSIDVKDLYEIRKVLEVPMAGLAAERASEEDIELLTRLYREMSSGMEDEERYIQADLEFHMGLASATKNRLFLILLAPLVEVLAADRIAIYKCNGAAVRGQEGHLKIVEAVRERDPQGAMKAMAEHLRQSEDALLLQKENKTIL